MELNELQKIPKNYKVKLTLLDERGQMVGDAFMEVDFLIKRKEHYDESGLDFNLSQIWQQYSKGIESE